MSKPHIVILGGGFAGNAVARELSRTLPAAERCAITLVDANNYLLFTPLLTEVVGGEVGEHAITAALRTLEPRVRFEQGRVESIDLGRKQVRLTIGGTNGVPATERSLRADILVLALGSSTNFHGLPGLPQHALTLKSVRDAASIRMRALALLERADSEPDVATRQTLLTFVVGGGGFSGVETMAALNDSVRRETRRYPTVREDDIRMLLVDPGGRLLPELDERLARYARIQLEDRGVEVVLNTKITGATTGAVTVDPALHSQREIPTHALIWTGGIEPNALVRDSDAPLGPHHGVTVDACCRVHGFDDIWALGDCAEVPRAGGGTYAPTAQNATREGTLVAHNIAATLRGLPAQPFHYQPVGELAIVGRHAGVASVYGVHLSGFIAWAAWRAIYLAKLPTGRKRARVAAEWLLDLAVGRETESIPG